MALPVATETSGTDHHEEKTVQDLIEQIKSGDERAFRTLVVRYRNQVAALAYRIVNDYEEAADIAQTVFIKMSRNIWRFDKRKKFYTWLYRITVNASIDHMRKHRRHRHEPIENHTDSFRSEDPDPDRRLELTLMQTYIEAASRTLNDKQRSAFVLRDVQGCRVNDVAEIMDMPEATVRWYLHRARSKMRSELKRRCPHLLNSIGLN
jgi:RNA polymerase sigma-70 factor (ECF subfamily)